ncbi:transcription factor BTF3-like [Lontra canadensis]|uniref:transcription factor BTF3-like n=1 Tax=Lontra canadensis TaxID=76717 RepID=UPI0013F3098C|nr:transcription factor BTF3-like [Lontra canadensis]
MTYSYIVTQSQGTVIHFNKPQVQAFLAANTFTITGQAETKLLTEMLPGMLKHLGADSLSSLRRSVKTLPTQSVDGGEPLATGEEEEGKVPDLVENFEEASKNEANLTESTSEDDKTQRSYWELLLPVAGLVFKILFMSLRKSRFLIFLSPGPLDTATLFSVCLDTICSLKLIKLKKPGNNV